MMRFRQDKLSKREDGFTLVELVVAMLILGIVIASLVTVQVRTLETNAETQARAQATALANAAMEEFRTVPWNVLKKGMPNGFLSASGGDHFVVSNQLVVGEITDDLIIAPSGISDQDLTHPWRPLYDSSGSHKQNIVDPDGRGTTFNVTAYVTESQTGIAGAIGLAVVVEWARPGAITRNTVIYSTAFAPSSGCGDLDTAPFLASCQPTYRANAASGSMSGNVFAYAYDTGTNTIGDPVVVIPSSTSGGTSTSGTGNFAEVDSAQNTVVSAAVEYPVSSVIPLATTENATLVGGGTRVFQASDNTVDPNAPTALGGFLSGTAPSSSTTTVAGVGALQVQGDNSRLGTATARTTMNCTTAAGDSITAAIPCATATTNASGGTGQILARWSFGSSVGTRVLDLLRGNTAAAQSSGAWAARFKQTSPAAGPSVGCTVRTGAGCVSAGARTSIPNSYVGRFTTGSWDGGVAPSGLVQILTYSDTLMVQRGAAQTGTPTHNRTASIQYWNGTAYQPLAVAIGTEASVTTESVTFTDSQVTLTAYATILVTKASYTVTGSDCTVDRCRVQVDNGLISVTMRVVVQPASGTPYMLEAVTLINGSTGLAQFTEPSVV